MNKDQNSDHFEMEKVPDFYNLAMKTVQNLDYFVMKKVKKIHLDGPNFAHRFSMNEVQKFWQLAIGSTLHSENIEALAQKLYEEIDFNLLTYFDPCS